MNVARRLDELLQTRYLTLGLPTGGFRGGAERVDSPWSFAALEGRLVSMLPGVMSASLSAVFQVIRDAQEEGETVAWVGGVQSGFYPPDAARWGVDLAAVAVIRVASDKDMWFAADTLIRSGGVGLVVIDSASMGDQRVSKGATVLQHRLSGLARTHGTAVLILPSGSERETGGALVSLTVQTQMRPLDSPASIYNVLVTPQRDKTGASHWKIEELCDAPDGLC
ncbi:MAG: hypothetical protein JXX29_15215 [Deltaproteobacteria bacterium]|nr:hypothetical protein [Deltaproteobacteria bacterium]MBN2673031.1 hypothetical protein [Deltaproteobacteria bacterium]